MKKLLSVFLVLLLALSASAAMAENLAKPADENKVYIGAVKYLTGDYQTIGRYYRESVDIAVEEINAAGGILGKQIEIVWIDEGDAIYTSLRIWTRNGAGEEQLLALGDKNIGAIYLGNIATPFALKQTDTNEQQGQVRATGLFLFEDGQVGSVQQLDLVA